MRHTRAVCLDLDDTLWDIAPVLRRAEEAFHDWLAVRYPRMAELETVDGLRARRLAVAEQLPESAHDISALRRELYRQLAEEAGCDPSMADEALAEFQRLRNRVTLYEDVIPALEILGRDRLLVALTNGTADLDVIGLGGYFDARFSAAGLGARKPEAAIFEGVCARVSLSPADIVHVGDDPENDVIGPRRVGMPAVWLNRSGMEWPAHVEPPDHVITDLYGLVSLLHA